MKNLLLIGILAYLLIGATSCSHWNWVFNNENLVREKICQPDTITQIVVKDTLIPLIQIDTGLLETLNIYETLLINYDDSVKNLTVGNTNLETVISNLHITLNKIRKLTTHQQTRIVTILKPFPVYHDSFDTLYKYRKAEEKAGKLIIWLYVLSFTIAGFMVIIAWKLIYKNLK